MIILGENGICFHFLQYSTPVPKINFVLRGNTLSADAKNHILCETPGYSGK